MFAKLKGRARLSGTIKRKRAFRRLDEIKKIRFKENQRGINNESPSRNNNREAVSKVSKQ